MFSSNLNKQLQAIRKEKQSEFLGQKNQDISANIIQLSNQARNLSRALQEFQTNFFKYNDSNRLSKSEKLQKQLNEFKLQLEKESQLQQVSLIKNIYPKTYFRYLKQLKDEVINASNHINILINNITENLKILHEQHVITLSLCINNLEELLQRKSVWIKEIENQVTTTTNASCISSSDLSKSSEKKPLSSSDTNKESNNDLFLQLPIQEITKYLSLEEIIKLCKINKSIYERIMQNSECKKNLQMQARAWFEKNTSILFPDIVRRIEYQRKKQNNPNFDNDWLNSYIQFQQALLNVDHVKNLPFWFGKTFNDTVNDASVSNRGFQRFKMFNKGISNGKIDAVFAMWLAGENLNSRYYPPIIEAIKKDYFEITRWLLNKGAADKVENGFNTLLNYSASFEMNTFLQQKKDEHEGKKTQEQIDSENHKAHLWFQNYMPLLAAKMEEQNEQSWSEKQKTIYDVLIVSKNNDKVDIQKLSLQLDWISRLLGKNPFSMLDLSSLNSAFLSAVKQDDTEQMIYLLAAGAYLNGKSFVFNCRTGWGHILEKSPLHQAAIFGSIKAFSLLLERGLAIDGVSDQNYMTAFDLAVYHGQSEMMNFLVGKPGGSPVKKNHESGFSPIFFAAAGGNLSSVNFLLDKGARIDDRDENKSTPLHWATYHQRPNVIALLIKHHASINAKDVDGQTPLHLAAIKGDVDCVAVLLKNGAQINIKDKFGKTPLDYANNPQIINMLNVKALVKEIDEKSVEWSFNPLKPFLIDYKTKQIKNFLFEQLKLRIKKEVEKHSEKTINEIITEWLNDDDLNHNQEDKVPQNNLKQLSSHRNLFFSKTREGVNATSIDVIEDMRKKYGHFKLFESSKVIKNNENNHLPVSRFIVD